MSELIQHSSETNEHYTPDSDKWPIVTMVREVIWDITLDPASCPIAQDVIQAKCWYGPGSSFGEDGLAATDWYDAKGAPSHAFLNPPGGLRDEDGCVVIRGKRGRNGYKGCTETGACGLPAGHKHKGVSGSANFWWQRLAVEYALGNVACGIFVCFSLEMLRSTQNGVWIGDLPIAFPEARVPYDKLDKEGTGRVASKNPPASSMFVLLPQNGQQVYKFVEVFGRIGKVRV